LPVEPLPWCASRSSTSTLLQPACARWISDTRSDDAAADDDDVCGFSHDGKVSRKAAKIAKQKGES
jgi:hypothetical protein